METRKPIEMSKPLRTYNEILQSRRKQSQYKCSLLKRGLSAAELGRLICYRTSFVLEKSPRRTLNDCNTQRPATIALVVAIAGMIFPAICLISNRDFVSIPKTIDRRLALADTKSSVSSSSLSNVIIGEAVESFDFACISRNLILSRSKLRQNQS
jgi:hypothetical protein